MYSSRSSDRTSGIYFKHKGNGSYFVADILPGSSAAQASLIRKCSRRQVAPGDPSTLAGINDELLQIDDYTISTHTTLEDIRSRILGSPETSVRLVFRRQDQERNDYDGGNGEFYFYNVELTRKLDRRQLEEEESTNESAIAARVKAYEDEILRLRRELVMLQQCVDLASAAWKTDCPLCSCRKTEENPRSKSLESELKANVDDMRELNCARTQLVE
eukprot:754355-Hanusia_phi.AAC.1